MHFKKLKVTTILVGIGLFAFVGLHPGIASANPEAEPFAKSKAQKIAELEEQAANAPLKVNWKYYKKKDALLKEAAAAEPGWKMKAPSEYQFGLYDGFWTNWWSPVGYNSINPVIHPSKVVGYPIKSGAFTDKQLESVNVTRKTRYIRGYLKSVLTAGQSSPAFYVLKQANNDMDQDQTFSGYPRDHYANIEEGQAEYLRVFYHWIDIPYDSLNKPVDVVLKRLKNKL